MSRAIRFPKQMTQNTILKYITFPPPQEHFKPFVTSEGRVLNPKISYSTQWRIRRCCEAAGIDPAVVGLPPLPEQKLPKHLLQKGNDRILEKLKKQNKIEENMKEMPKRIEQYRQERKKGRESSRPDLPF